MDPKVPELLRLRREHPHDKPNVYRCRALTRFFADLASNEGLGNNDLLKDAIHYRQAYWMNVYIFQRSPQDVVLEFNRLTDQDHVAFYSEIMKRAALHIERTWPMIAE
jgi:hypothetical protein